MTGKLAKWGNSLAVRIPARLVDGHEWKEGNALDITEEPDGSIRIKPKEDQAELDALLSQITAENLHEELDWGKSVGNESW